MAYPVSGGFSTTPAYSGTFIPELWSAKLNAKFYKTSVFGEITNTDWEGEIKGLGDTLHIMQIPDITVSDYTVDDGTGAAGNLTYQIPTPSKIDLLIDQGKYFAFQTNDVLMLQSKPNLMEMFTDDATEKMRTAVDAKVLYDISQGVNASNAGATAGAISGNMDLGTDSAPVAITGAGNEDNALDLVLRMATVLDEQNIPSEGRWMVISPAFRMALFGSRLAQAYVTGDTTSPLRNGRIGQIDRFTLYVSNNLPLGDTDKTLVRGDQDPASGSQVLGNAKRQAIIAGHRSGVAFASQINKVETVRNPNNFGDYVRGLQVYGDKVVLDTAVALALVTR